MLKNVRTRCRINQYTDTSLMYKGCIPMPNIKNNKSNVPRNIFLI